MSDIYVAMGVVPFRGANAQDLARNVEAHTRILAIQSGHGSAGAEILFPPYFGSFKVESDGTLTPDKVWHHDRFGIVRPGVPTVVDGDPDWIAPTIAEDSYPYFDVEGNRTVVRYQGKRWRNTYSAGKNSWAPPTFWEEIE